MTQRQPLDLPAFMRSWRALRHKDGSKIVQAELDLVLAAIEGRWTGSKKPVVGTSSEPRWLIEARSLQGTREIPGPKHNTFISNGWGRLDKKLGLTARYNDDETPWCGLFVAHCIDASGIEFPRLYPRALAWDDWGQPCPPCVGAVATFKRGGGGHVGFLVGEDATRFYVLGGNQSNAVNVMPLDKARLSKTRWPKGVAVPGRSLPRMTGGVSSTNER